jgi:predicted RND superfamily exporter protein
VVTTTLLLVGGFASILGSEFRGTFEFGALVCLSLAGALASAMVLLPALLRLRERGAAATAQAGGGPP